MDEIDDAVVDAAFDALLKSQKFPRSELTPLEIDGSKIHLRAAIKAAVLAERERIASYVEREIDESSRMGGAWTAKMIADAIRARGSNGEPNE